MICHSFAFNILGCRTQPYIENGMVNYTNAMTYGSHATISCNENYVLRGDSFLECLNDGTWSGNAVCRGKQSHDHIG